MVSTPFGGIDRVVTPTDYTQFAVELHGSPQYKQIAEALRPFVLFYKTNHWTIIVPVIDGCGVQWYVYMPDDNDVRV